MFKKITLENPKYDKFSKSFWINASNYHFRWIEPINLSWTCATPLCLLLYPCSVLSYLSFMMFTSHFSLMLLLVLKITLGNPKYGKFPKSLWIGVSNYNFRWTKPGSLWWSDVHHTCAIFSFSLSLLVPPPIASLVPPLLSYVTLFVSDDILLWCLSYL